MVRSVIELVPVHDKDWNARLTVTITPDGKAPIVNVLKVGEKLELSRIMLGTGINRFEFSTTDLNKPWTLSAGLYAVPIPAAVWLFGSGLVGLLVLRRRHSV